MITSSLTTLVILKNYGRNSIRYYIAKVILFSLMIRMINLLLISLALSLLIRSLEFVNRSQIPVLQILLLLIVCLILLVNLAWFLKKLFIKLLCLHQLSHVCLILGLLFWLRIVLIFYSFQNSVSQLFIISGMFSCSV